MIDALRQLEAELATLTRAVRKIKALHVNAKDAKENVRATVYRYFNEWRPGLVNSVGGDSVLTRLDSEMHELLRCTQRRTPVKDYQDLLKRAHEALSELEMCLIKPKPQELVSPTYNGQHQKILEMLEKVCPSAGRSFQQGLNDFSDQDRRSWRGTAVEFREALREVLDQLAPDEQVRVQPGYKQEPDTDSPTMKQKAVFVLKSRRPKDPQVKAFAEAIDIVENLIGKFVRAVYTRSTLSVHTASSRDEVGRIRDYVSLVLVELLEVSL